MNIYSEKEYSQFTLQNTTLVTDSEQLHHIETLVSDSERNTQNTKQILHFINYCRQSTL